MNVLETLVPRLTCVLRAFRSAFERVTSMVVRLIFLDEVERVRLTESSRLVASLDPCTVIAAMLRVDVLYASLKISVSTPVLRLRVKSVNSMLLLSLITSSALKVPPAVRRLPKRSSIAPLASTRKVLLTVLPRAVVFLI